MTFYNIFKNIPYHGGLILSPIRGLKPYFGKIVDFIYFACKNTL